MMNLFKKSFIVLFIVPIFLQAKNCYESSIIKPTPFMGNNGEIFKLANGTIGEIKYEYEYMYEYYPKVIVCPNENQLIVKGKTLSIQLISKTKQSGNAITLIESQIAGTFEGFNGDTIIKLTNGQIWQQTEYFYTYHYAYMPKVVIFQSDTGYKMQVDGVDKSVGVAKLK